MANRGQSTVGSMLVVDVGRILFVGTVGEIEPHRAMVPLFAAGLDCEYEITVNNVARRFRTSVAPADLVRGVNGFGGRMAVMPIDPVLAPAEALDPERCLDLLATLAEEFDTETWAQLCMAIGLGHTDADKPAGLLDAMRLIRSSSEENVPGAEIASEVGFSLSHLQHLFRVHLGTSIRSYRTWSRFVSLANGMAQGHSITDSAAAAGFFDSAHFTKAFQQTFGIPPSYVFDTNAVIHVVPPSSEI